ncbi:MAG: hypothetical protein IT376_18010 [Polyangiaceae bacterium]|nr:hypothetical protein [Polyangiaceae bacterium]
MTAASCWVRRSRLGLVVVGLAGATACSDEDSGAAVAAPLPPPELEILGMQPAGGPAWSPGDPCLERGRDASGTVAVSLGPNPQPGTLSNWTLRPRYGCDDSRCGYVVLRVDPGADGGEALSVSASATSVALPLGSLPAPDGPHTLRAELHHAVSLTAFTTVDGVLAATVEVEIRAPGGCGVLPSADAGSTD